MPYLIGYQCLVDGLDCKATSGHTRVGYHEKEAITMGGNLNVDSGHGRVPDHLDHIQYGEWGNIAERYDKYGNLLDMRFTPSDKLALELGIKARPYPLSGVSSPYQNRIARSG